MQPEAALARIAARQYSVFTRRQALDVGITRGMIERNVQRGSWSRLHNGVFVPAAVVVGWEQRVIGACLACGPDAGASYSAAGRIWEFVDAFDVPDVTIPGTKLRRRPGLRVHRTEEPEIVRYRLFPVTSPRRTLLDLASVLDEPSLERTLDNAHRRGLIEPDAFMRYLEARPRPGSETLRTLVHVRNGAPIGSDAETLLFRALRRAGLPLPVTQHPLDTRRRRRYIDFAYPDHRLAIEVDGWTDHGARAAFESDRMRQNELVELGWHVLRFTWTQLTTDPIGVAVTVGVALGLRPARWRPAG